MELPLSIKYRCHFLIVFFDGAYFLNFVVNFLFVAVIDRVLSNVAVQNARCSPEKSIVLSEQLDAFTNIFIKTDVLKIPQ